MTRTTKVAFPSGEALLLVARNTSWLTEYIHKWYSFQWDKADAMQANNHTVSMYLRTSLDAQKSALYFSIKSQE